MKKANLSNLVVYIAVVLLPINVWAVETASVTEVNPFRSMESPDVEQVKPLVQMAILLDTSGSMTGLIDQARTELWSIVNEFIYARQNGIAPEVQVALYEYGKSSLSSKDGYIRQIVPLTTDLDKISEELFALTTNGGEEYCGWVIKEAVKSLKWSSKSNDLKVICIAGNEPFTQGSVDYKQSCRDAIAKGIIVNTIHCGSEREGIDGKWKDGAALADGTFFSIDHNTQVAYIAAPQDKEIAELGAKLNDTYIAYGGIGGMGGGRGARLQAQQDLNASSISAEASVSRALTKSSANYRNSSWDLVDALKDKKVSLEEIDKQELPENMQEMSQEQRKTYIQTKTNERAEIQKKIHELNLARNNYLAAERQKQQADPNTLGTAMSQALRSQAAGRNFEFQIPELQTPESSQTQVDSIP